MNSNNRNAWIINPSLKLVQNFINETIWKLKNIHIKPTNITKEYLMDQYSHI